MVPCTGESPPTGQVAKEGNFASQSSNKLTISTINRLNLREAEQLRRTPIRSKAPIYRAVIGCDHRPHPKGEK
jgi:hypothetical protein